MSHSYKRRTKSTEKLQLHAEECLIAKKTIKNVKRGGKKRTWITNSPVADINLTLLIISLNMNIGLPRWR